MSPKITLIMPSALISL